MDKSTRSRLDVSASLSLHAVDKLAMFIILRTSVYQPLLKAQQYCDRPVCYCSVVSDLMWLIFECYYILRESDKSIVKYINVLILVLRFFKKSVFSRCVCLYMLLVLRLSQSPYPYCPHIEEKNEEDC